ncbi:molybdopterin-dependent oxidoreductase, partial [Candidatus Protofrankia californiensis]|uniref:molybdopterin-dependent oxidoreductase n=1 Tax=Candidatus Protofrankia californiensis TaxID=1839754 RepID=UPI0019CF7F59
RRGWLEDGPGPDSRRGDDSFVELPWPQVLDLVAAELERVRARHGNTAIFGGSYGWSSAGRFHHAQSQLHRFLGLIGGFTRSVNSYSLGAAHVILPHILGRPGEFAALREGTSWPVIAEHTDLLVAFGGVRASNLWVTPGGRARHTARHHLLAAAGRGMRVVSLSPIRDDIPAEVGASWLPLVPGSDVAVMLALCHVLLTEGLADRAFLDRYTVGADRFEQYVLGRTDGQPKDPSWAARISGLDADDLRTLARRMAGARTLVTVGWSLQRIEHGEQPLWAVIALAALLGQIGLPGAGFGLGYGSMGDVGGGLLRYGLPTFSQGHNPVRAFIPVARIADLLLRPGKRFDYDGGVHTYPDIRLVHWAGGNPFHHHQDLTRLRRALTRPDTIIVHEPYWTATARHADIVLPVTTSLERDDIGAGRGDSHLSAMRRVLAPFGESRDEYDILTGLARRLEVEREFTEGRTSRQWLVHLYERWRATMLAAGRDIPGFDEFWSDGSDGEVALPDRHDRVVLFEDFRADPGKARLSTPSGRIEIFSATVEGFGYDDCPGHPTWLEPAEWLGAPAAARFPLHLIANQPATRLHGQLDMGAHSQASKIAGREPLRMHPSDADARGLRDGDVVRVRNDRGSCLAGVVRTDALRPGVVQMSTGAWFDYSAPAVATCVHGNPNALTADRGTSRLAQGCTGQHALVEVERLATDAPP